MTREEKIRMVEAMYGRDLSNDVLDTYLNLAEEIVLNRVYPFGRPQEATIPRQYEFLTVQVAHYLLVKQGAEGERVHSENGVSITYFESILPKSLLDEIIPKGGLVY